jgi:hypothetical protein
MMASITPAAVDGQGNVYIADDWNGRVLYFRALVDAAKTTLPWTEPIRASRIPSPGCRPGCPASAHNRACIRLRPVEQATPRTARRRATTSPHGKMVPMDLIYEESGL